MSTIERGSALDPFGPTELGPLRLRNHFIKAATFEGMAVDNLVTDRLIEFHRVMAAGGLGMTTVAYLAVSPDGQGAPAEIVGTAPNYDLAVLRLSRVRQPPPAIPIGSSADLKVGQTTFAIGNPFGLDQTLTTGVISALQRRLPTAEGREIADAIQTDAAINPGNSGGPLLDSAGRLIGVNTAIYSPSGAYAGIGFAIPVDVVNRVVPQLVVNGRMPTPGIGIIVAQEAAAAQLGIQGVVIVRTVPGSPAERAGLRGLNPGSGAIGDVVVAANGRPVRRLADLTAVLEEAGVGKPVELTIDRSGSTTRVSVEVADVGRAARGR